MALGSYEKEICQLIIIYFSFTDVNKRINVVHQHIKYKSRSMLRIHITLHEKCSTFFKLTDNTISQESNIVIQINVKNIWNWSDNFVKKIMEKSCRLLLFNLIVPFQLCEVFKCLEFAPYIKQVLLNTCAVYCMP